MQLPDYFEFMCPVKTGSGYRALEHIPMDLSLLDARRPLIVTEKCHEDNGLVKKLVGAFNGSGLNIGVYDGVTEMSGLDTVRELYSLYLDKGFDSIISLGNGRVVDVAKVLNIAVSGKFEDIKAAEGTDNIREPLRPFILVPVSSGTCMETSGKAAIGDKIFFSQFLMPNIVTIDPRMLNDKDPGKIVCTAYAALTYAAESYVSDQHNPFSVTYAQLTVDFVMNNLIDVVKDALTPKKKLKALIHEYMNKNAQIALANAACMAGYVYSNTPEGLAAKIGRTVSAYCDTCECLIMGILLPYVLEYHAVKKGTRLSKLLRPMSGLDLFCITPEQQRFTMAIGKIRHLQNELYSMTSAQIPRTLEDTKLSKDKLSEIAAKVMEGSNGDCDVNDCLMILEHAYSGKPITA